MAHRRARLTPFGRLLLVHRILEEHGGRLLRQPSRWAVSGATAHKWLRRFGEEGAAGLEDRSSAPHRCPHALPSREIRRIVRARRRWKLGPHRLGPRAGTSPLDGLRGPPPRGAVQALAPGSADRDPGALRARSSRRARAHRREEARTGADRRRAQAAWPGCRSTQPRAATATTTCMSPSTIAPAGPTSRCTPMSGARPAPGSFVGAPSTTPPSGSRSSG